MVELLRIYGTLLQFGADASTMLEIDGMAQSPTTAVKTKFSKLTGADAA